MHRRERFLCGKAPAVSTKDREGGPGGRGATATRLCAHVTALAVRDPSTRAVTGTRRWCPGGSRLPGVQEAGREGRAVWPMEAGSGPGGAVWGLERPRLHLSLSGLHTLSSVRGCP